LATVKDNIPMIILAMSIKMFEHSEKEGKK